MGKTLATTLLAATLTYVLLATSAYAATSTAPDSLICGASTNKTPTGVSPVAQQVPRGPESRDASWPIAAQWTEITLLPTGELVTTTFTLRLSPAANESAALGTTCAYLGPGSIQSAQQLGGVTAYLKNFFDLYRWENTEGGGTWRAHYTTETDEWWDRTGTSWSVGQNSTTWTFNAWNCQNIWDPRQTNGGFTPAWQDATRSYLYVYNFFIPWGWPTLSHPPGVGMMRTAEASPILLNGQNYGTINLVIDYPVYL